MTLIVFRHATSVKLQSLYAAILSNSSRYGANLIRKGISFFTHLVVSPECYSVTIMRICKVNELLIIVYMETGLVTDMKE